LTPTPSPSASRSKAGSHPLREGWLVLALATITAVLTGPGQTIGVSVFIDPMVSDLGISRSEMSSAYLVGTLLGSFAMPFVGRFVDRRGVRVAQIIVGLLFAGALVNMSLVNGLIWLAVGFTGIRMLGQGSLSMISTVTVQLKFTRSRGLAIGVFAMASSALMALVPLVLNATIGGLGWRQAWVLSAFVILVTVVPIGWFGLRSLPSPSVDGKMLDYGVEQHRNGQISVDTSLDRATAIRTSGFWILAAISSTTGMLSTGLNFHQIDLLGDAGLSADQAAAMFLPQVAGSILAGLVVGGIADRVGSRYLPAASMILLTLVHLIGAFVMPGGIVLLYAFLLGSVGGSVRTITATLLPDWFGTGHIGSIQGVLTLINVAGSALGPLLLAQLDSAFGGYRSALLTLALLPVVVAIGASVTKPPSRIDGSRHDGRAGEVDRADAGHSAFGSD